eukprot:1391835-Amorphochlora_amoeboformis.AAC.1
MVKSQPRTFVKILLLVGFNAVSGALHKDASSVISGQHQLDQNSLAANQAARVSGRAVNATRAMRNSTTIGCAPLCDIPEGWKTASCQSCLFRGAIET